MNEKKMFSMYGTKPTPPMMPHRYVRNKTTREVVRCNAFAPATRRYDVETVDGQTMTLEQTQIATDVTEAEELKFMAANPESN
jgi:hypothetical protein